MLKYYKYPLKVWLTSSFIGTIVYLLVLLARSCFQGANAGNVFNLTADNYTFMLVIILIAIFCSIPCWLILWLAFAKLSKKTISKTNLKAILLMISLVIGNTCIIFTYKFLLNGIDLASVLEIALSYSLALVFCIWFYELNPNTITAP